MSAISTRRRRASLAFGTALAFTAASLTIGMAPASAADEVDPLPINYATVDDHDSGGGVGIDGATNSQLPGFWCPTGTVGFKAEGSSYSTFGTLIQGGYAFTLNGDANPNLEGDQPYALVVVKAGSENSVEYSNTLFSQPAPFGTVWADSDGSSLGEAEGPVDPDKEISHIIICAGTTPPGYVEAVKEWTYTGADPSKAQDFVAGTPGTLTFNEVVKPWTKNTTEYPAGTKVTVAEAGNSKPPTATGYECTVLTGATTYTVGNSTTTTPAIVTVASESTVKVTITNTANCTVPAPSPGSVEAVKEWTYTGADPSKAQDFVAGTPGTLTFNEVVKPWTKNTTEYPAGTKVTVAEAGNSKPPTATGYECTVLTGATTYTVGNSTTTTPAIVTIASESTVKVTITNTANCTTVTPPAVIPPGVTPPAVTPPVVTQPVTDVDEGAVVGTEEDEDDAVEDDESAVAGSEDELAATGGNTSAALLGALLVLSGAALIGSRRRFGMNS